MLQSGEDSPLKVKSHCRTRACPELLEMAASYWILCPFLAVQDTALPINAQHGKSLLVGSPVEEAPHQHPTLETEHPKTCWVKTCDKTPLVLSSAHLL